MSEMTSKCVKSDIQWYCTWKPPSSTDDTKYNKSSWSWNEQVLIASSFRFEFVWRYWNRIALISAYYSLLLLFIFHETRNMGYLTDGYIFLKGKYVVGLKKFVDRQMVDKFLSKNFRRHSTSSTRYFVEKYFV
jgi:hypothetical protein